MADKIEEAPKVICLKMLEIGHALTKKIDPENFKNLGQKISNFWTR